LKALEAAADAAVAELTAAARADLALIMGRHRRHRSLEEVS
jgi:hypothetical protein